MARAVLGELAWAQSLQGEEEDHELASLVAPPVAPAWRAGKLRRRVLVGVSLGIAALCGFAVKRGLAPCVPSVGTDIVSLVQASPDEVIGLSAVSEKPGLLINWLKAANGAGNAASKNPGGETSMELAKAANEAIHKALLGGDPKAAEKLAEKLMKKAVERNIEKRKELAKFAKDEAGDKGPEDAASTPAKKAGLLEKLVRANTKPVTEQASDAACVINILGLTTSFATVATNINDVSRTCEGVGFDQLMNSKVNQTHSKVCAVNLAALIAGLASMSTSIATATDECAQTIIPNVDALCSAAITGMMTATAAFGGSFTLISAACRSKGWYGQIPAGVTPSNVGSNDLWRKEVGEEAANAAIAKQRGGVPRKLQALRAEYEAEEEEEDGATSAPARKLLFGGGKGALATQCATEILNIAWGLADFALAINSAANPDMKPSCPPTNLKGGTNFKGPIYTIKEQMCTVDIGSVLVAFFGTMTFAQLLAVTCTDTINLGAICGSGVTGSLAAAAGIVKTAAGMAVACDTAQKPIIHELLSVARELDVKTGYAITKLMRSMGDDGVDASVPATFGVRRLREAQISELKAKYATPVDVWKSLGYDIEDPNAEWRRDAEPAPIPDHFLHAIIEEVEGRSVDAEEPGLLGQRTCEA